MALNDELVYFLGNNLSSHPILSGLIRNVHGGMGNTQVSGCVITRKIKDFVLGNNGRLPQADPWTKNLPKNAPEHFDSPLEIRSLLASHKQVVLPGFYPKVGMVRPMLFFFSNFMWSF